MTSTTSRIIGPSDEAILAVVHTLRETDNTSGAKSLLSSILSLNDTWTLSEKRLRKLLQREGLTLTSGSDERSTITSDIPGQTGHRAQILSSDGLAFPHSRLNEDLMAHLGQMSKKVEVKYFDAQRGKGLIAREPIRENEVIWREDPFIYCPAEWELQSQQLSLLRCTSCLITLPSSKSPPISCPSSCGTASWCTRLCFKRNKIQHMFLCPQQNPACGDLKRFVLEEKWIALGAWMRVVAIFMGEWAEGHGSETPSWKLVDGLAEMSLSERVKLLPNWQASAAAAEVLWKRAHDLFVQAFASPSNPLFSKKLAKLKKGRALPTEIYDALLGYEGFLKGLGKMSLNLEAHGGVYALHSHLNHSCAPNVSVRHFDPELGRVTVLAKTAITPGTELVVTYVNPSDNIRKRRRELREWGFGECKCEKCVKEELEDNLPENGSADLEDELRGFLGV